MALIFVGGMLVGNVYLPARNATLAASISVPGAVLENDALQQCTLPQAEQNLNVLGQALNSCPVVVNEEKDRLMNQIKVLLARQDFEIKKARYELEIAKNAAGTRTTSEFAKASADYAAALTYLDNLVNAFFPKPEPAAQETPSEETAQAASASAQTEQSAQSADKKDTKNTAKESAPKTSDKKAASAKKQSAAKANTTKATPETKPAGEKAQTAAPAENAKKSPASTEAGETKK